MKTAAAKPHGATRNLVAPLTVEPYHDLISSVLLKDFYERFPDSYVLDKLW